MGIAIQTGMILTPARLNALAPLSVRKTTDQTVTNNAALVNDTQLFTPSLPALAEYDVEIKLIYEAPTGNDLRVAFSFPTGAQLPWGVIALDTAAASVAGDLRPAAFGNPGSSQAFVIGGGGAGNQLVALMRGTLVMGATPGGVELRWSQGTAAGGTSAIVKAGSTLQLRRIA